MKEMNHARLLTLFTSVKSSRDGISGCRWKVVTNSIHKNPNPVLSPDNVILNKNSSVDIETSDPWRGPKLAAHARPPSNLNIGSKFKEDAIKPEYPTTKSGWTGIGCASGNIMIFGAIHDNKEPIRKLDLSLMAGSTGKFVMAS